MNLLMRKYKMTTFAEAVVNQDARTENGMLARKSTADANVDLFFKIGASRGKQIVPQFARAMSENPDIALRIAQWARDVRGGAGERKLFIDILEHLNDVAPKDAIALVQKVPELGRWKDLIEAQLTGFVRDQAFYMIEKAMLNGDGLCAKWMPRKGPKAVELRKFMGWTPKRYRKTLVQLSNTVESLMCDNKWDVIDFNKVPSLAHARYKKAFNRHTDEYAKYVESLVKGETKVNAGAVYPYDVIKGVSPYGRDYGPTEIALINEQWKALPNFVGDANILPIVDVSGSMTCPVGGNAGNLSCLDVAVSLGLYLSEKNTGKFKDVFATFSNKPQLEYLMGKNVVERMAQMVSSDWGMNTDLHRTLDQILHTAKKGGVPQEEMPDMLLILSDMQFDDCIEFDDTAYQMIQRKYEGAGYTMPNIVFWNINAYDNVPVEFDKSGVALISGFSPSIVKSVLSSDMEQFTPYNIMMNTVMVDRYKL